MKLRKVLGLLLVIIVTLHMQKVYAQESQLYESNNQNCQDYTVRASTIKSYLYEGQNKELIRVECVSGVGGAQVIVKTYDSSLNLQTTQYIEMELPVFGGFYAGSQYNYLVFGQENYEEDDRKEVMRVVRYTKEWKRMDCVSLQNINTVEPFRAGSLRMVETEDQYLIIRTCHTMYKSGDGYNHQANMTFQIDVSNSRDMSITDAFYEVWNVSGYGYVSHSFNQFIAIDAEKRLIALDHGDAYPRANVLIRFNKSTDSNKMISVATNSWNLLEYPGENGANETGGSIGGLQCGSSRYITVGNYTNTSSEFVRNIYITSTSLETDEAADTKTTWLTKYTKDSAIRVTTPQIVKCKEDQYLVLWGFVQKSENGYWWDFLNKVSYVFVDEEGVPISDARTITANLSDCQPILYDRRILWYVTNTNGEVFYTIDEKGVATTVCAEHKWGNGTITKQPTCLNPGTKTYTCSICGKTKTVKIEEEKNISTCSITGIQTSYTYTGKEIRPAIKVLDGNKEVASNYIKVSYSNCLNAGTAQVIITGTNGFSGKIVKSFVIKKKTPTITVSSTNYSRTYGDKAFTITAKAPAGCTITYKSSQPKVAAVSSKGSVKIVGCGIAKITITVQGNNYSKVEKNVVVKIKPKKEVVKSISSTAKGKLKVVWNYDKYATGYQLQLSTNSKFSKNSTKTTTVSKKTTTSKSFTKLNSKKKYYVRVRSYKAYGKETLYGTWSSVQKIKIK